MGRHIDFEAIENFRDFGGYETACGRGLATGRLYRSGHHFHATDADLARLKSLGIGAIADLRQARERVDEPSRRWDGFAAQVFESDLVSSTADWVEALKTSPLTAEYWYESTFANYGRHAFEPRQIAVMRSLFRHLAEGAGAVVIHCAAGKDRTGTACALVHHLAGIPREALIADYLLTNDESRIARKMESSANFVERITGRRPTDEAMRVAVSVYPEYLDAFFGAICAAHGSVDAYLADVMGVDATMRDRIRKRILGPA